jgi:hypothetical protein
MDKDRDNEIKAIRTVFDEYLPRFNNILLDTRFIALAVVHTNVDRIYGSIDNAVGREGIRNSALRFVELEGYTVFKFSLTFYWAEIESFIDAFLKSWLTYAKPPATLEIFEKITFAQSVREFENLTRSEVITLYVQGLKDKVRAGSEIKTFFAALDKVGLSECDGDEKKNLERTFTELQQIRNIMVHKSGIVDKRMITACPWLKSRPEIEVGKLYPLSIEVMQDYGKRIFDLTDHILDRLGKYADSTWTVE